MSYNVWRPTGKVRPRERGTPNVTIKSAKQQEELRKSGCNGSQPRVSLTYETVVELLCKLCVVCVIFLTVSDC